MTMLDAHMWVRFGVSVLSVALLAWLVVWAVRRVRQAPRGWGGAVAVLTALALGLRLTAPWGSHDLNLRNLNAWGGSYFNISRYGHGVEGLVDPFAHGLKALGLSWTPLHLVTLFALLSTAQVPLLVRIARQLGSGRASAWAAGALLAVHPAMVRFARTDVQAVPEVLWTLIGLTLWLTHTRTGERPAAWGAAAALGLAAHARPEALAVPAVLAIGFAVRDPSALRRRVSWEAAAIAAVLAGPQLVAQLVRALGGQERPDGVPGMSGDVPHPIPVHGFRHFLGLDPAWVGWAAVGCVLLLPLAREPSRRTRAVYGVTAFVMALLVEGDSSCSAVDGEGFGFARHQLRSLPFFALATAWGATAVARWGSRPWLVPAALGGVVVVAASRLPLAYEPRIGQGEFRFFVEIRDAFPRGCTVYAPAFPYDAGMRPPRSLVPHEPVVFTESPAVPDALCWLYYRSAECSMAFDPPLAPACDRFEAAHDLEVIEERWLGTGTWIYDRHLLDPVRVGLYRVKRPWVEVPGFGEE